MSFQEFILLSLSREPESKDYSAGKSEGAIDNSLSLLIKEYPNFGALVSGKRVADFGCGTGYQSIALVQKYDCSVVGIDSNKNTLEKAIENAKSYNISQSRLSFVDRVSDNMLNSFDFVISQNSFEHYSNPSMVLVEMRGLINKLGKILITFGPPWFAPYGSHMQFFTKVPWVNILFSEQAVLKVRARFRNDGAMKYENVESGLNKMSVGKFEKIISQSGFKSEYWKYECVKDLMFLAKIPVLRELFVNHISCILTTQ